MSTCHNPKTPSQPRVPGRRIAIELAVFLALTAGWHAFLRTRGADNAVFFAVLAAVLGWLSVCAIRGLLCRENEKALDRAMTGRPPLDGHWTAAAGTIQPLTQPPLAAPFSGQEALAYQYWISRFENRTAGPEDTRRLAKNRHLITAYSGWAIIPCEIRTPGGPIRLKGMPVLQSKASTLSDPDAYARAQAYIAHTDFSDAFQDLAEHPAPGTPSPALKMDIRENPGSSLDGWMLDETRVRPGEQVCAYGLYSSADQTIRAPAQPTAGRLFSLIPGDTAAAKAQLRAQRLFLQITLALLLTLQFLIAWRAS